jgi:hypothetical protein
MVDKEHIRLFHWSHSINKHTKQLIWPKLQDEHKVFCHQYKNAKSLGDANNHCALICSWWLLSRAASKACVHELSNWLGFWHFRVKQWGDFMVHVNVSFVNFLWLPFSSMCQNYKISIFIELPFAIYLLFCANISYFSDDSFHLICRSLMMRNGRTCPHAI